MLIYRVLPVFIINLMLVLVYSAIRYFLMDELDMSDSLRSIAFGGNTVANGWYLQVIMWFYALFIIVSQIDFSHMIPIVFFVTAIYMIVCFVLGVQPWWYVSTLSLPIGAFVSKNSDKVAMFVGRSKKYKQIFLINVAGFLGLYLFRFYIVPKPAFVYYFLFLGLIISIVLFASVVYLSTKKITYESKALRFLGNYYLEIYVMQGLVFMFLRNNHWKISNPCLFVLAAIIGTLLIAIVTKPIFSFIQTRIKHLAHA